ncbi:hypothetical protein GCM10025791_06620 [Halioxenophilus aromaticivorans]|uniref:Type 4 fimbrial biogenesis protein PilX N-terminal domain-containing protein n=2 Tax=Halioxenophilus aromaticivorans TaxID=1306992 RepID=A0AAV3TXY1_9ALTE
MDSQRGAVLIVSLILLLVLTMVVLSANRGVVIQERATNAVRESNVVFQVAESALLEAEAHINSVMAAAGVAAFNDNGTNGLYAEGKGPSDYLAKTTWAKNNTKAAAQLSTAGYSASYFIEHLGEMAMPGQNIGVDLNNNYKQADEIPMANVFRVVVRAQGSQGTPVRMLSGYYSF